MTIYNRESKLKFWHCDYCHRALSAQDLHDITDHKVRCYACALPDVAHEKVDRCERCGQTKRVTWFKEPKKWFCLGCYHDWYGIYD